MVPQYNHLSEHDDLSYPGCAYTASYDAYHWNNNVSFTNVSAYILPVVRQPYSKAFGFDVRNSYNMTYPQFYDFADQLVAEDFEGDPSRYKFTSDQWYYTRSLCRYMVETPMNDKGRVLFITKLLR